MSKKWSSFKEQQLLTENFRKWVNEEEDLSAIPKVSSWSDEPEPEAETELEPEPEPKPENPCAELEKRYNRVEELYMMSPSEQKSWLRQSGKTGAGIYKRRLPSMETVHYAKKAYLKCKYKYAPRVKNVFTGKE